MIRTRSRVVGSATILTVLMMLTAGCNQGTATGPAVRLVAMPSSVTTIVGETAKITVTIAPIGGFSGSLALSLRTSTGQVASGLSLSPASVTLSGGRSVTLPLTLSVAESRRAGSETVDLSATHNGSTQAIPLSLALDYSGTFGTSTTYPVSIDNTAYPANNSMGAASVAAVDVSGDGVPDVVLVGSRCSTECSSADPSFEGTVWVLINNGSGTFPVIDPSKPNVPAYAAGSGDDPQSVALADVTGNGFPDVVTGGTIGSTITSGSVGVLPNAGNATFGLAATYSTYYAGEGYTDAAAVGDVNGDGLPDIVAADRIVAPDGSMLSKISVLLNTGSGTFGSATNYDAGVDNPDSVAVLDVDGDGHPDIVTAGKNADGSVGMVSVLRNTGNGTFGAPRTYVVESGDVPQSKVSMAVGDLNGDGKPDLVLFSFSDGVWVMLNNGDGTFGARTRTPFVIGQPVLAGGVAVADVNGDGHPDIVLAGCYGSTTCADAAAVMLNKGDGTFATVEWSTVINVSGLTDSVTVADVNGDGKPDIITGNAGDASGPNSVSILLGQ